MLFRLALAMHRTVGELLAALDSRQLSEWIAYLKIEPLADSWAQTGLLASLLHNAHFAGPRKSPSDFIPAAPAPRALQDAGRGLAAIRGIAARMNASKGG